MKQTTLTTWLLKLPLKFAILSFISILLISFLYPFIVGLLSGSQQISTGTMFAIIIVGILTGTYFSVKKAPRIKMDSMSFITIHTAQTLFMFLLFCLSTYLLISSHQNLLFNMMIMESKFSGTTPILILLLAISFLYMLGVEIFNIYAKIRCMQNFNIPSWKILLSIPFGFSALWVPGYLINTKKAKKPSQEIHAKWYAKLINWTVKNRLNTISMFVFITILTSFFAGLSAILLTFSFALMFGIWNLQVGAQQFEKNMAKKYSSVAVIINIALIILFICTYIFAPKTQQNIQINISDTEVVSTQGQ